MSGLLNGKRPPAFCAGCSHERVVHALDRALQTMGVPSHKAAIVSDIGCSGLFDTFFNTHAFHGLHGRALTYATGLKLARPELTIITTMGDGGLGIGGAHVLSACRRNVNLTLLVLNNFNFGMTGGQCSATTPEDVDTASGFLNKLEKPLDICMVAQAAGAPYVSRVMATQKDLSEQIEKAVTYNGFAVLDIWGLCPGRYLKRNKWTLQQMKKEMDSRAGYGGVIADNERPEYAGNYFRQAKAQKGASGPLSVETQFKPVFIGRREVLLLGAAGQRINTAGEILCLAALSSGLHATQKNDYPITVLRGHSISELVLSSQSVDYTGISDPGIVLALASEGVDRRKDLFEKFGHGVMVIKAKDLDIPSTAAKVIEIDFKAHSIKYSNRALAALAVLAQKGLIINHDMLKAAVVSRYEGRPLKEALSLIEFISKMP